MRDKSMRVTKPRMLITRNVPAVIKNVDAIDDMVYTKNIDDMVTPISTEYRINSNVAAVIDNLLIQADMIITKAS